MITNWIITGDTHGWVETRLGNIGRNVPYPTTETGVIILGDAGLNFWLGGSDKKHKKESAKYGYTIYCVHGNHEERPENLGYALEYDENVSGDVYVDDTYPNIRYFKDGGEYNIGGHSCLVIGGAYSIDKWYRLERAKLSGQSFSGWFESEQLTQEEKDAIAAKVKDKHYDFVFTHTTAISWEPVDLFLNGVDQSRVDKSMEIWLDAIKNTFTWGVWCFGHYHADRIERPFVEQFYYEYEPMEDVWNRWQKYKETSQLDWWLPKSPAMADILYRAQNGEF